jgi:hypothetical protein
MEIVIVLTNRITAAKVVYPQLFGSIELAKEKTLGYGYSEKYWIKEFRFLKPKG